MGCTLCRVATKFYRRNSRIIQGYFKDLFAIFKDVQTHMKCCVAAPIRRFSVRCTALSTKFKDFKDRFRNSRTFQGSSNIFTKIQGCFKDQHEIQGFQGFFLRMWQPCYAKNCTCKPFLPPP